MALPLDPDARLYYRVAEHRYEDGELLLESQRPHAAIYLTGYAIECILKALLLVTTPESERPDVLGSFRGSKAHSIESLRNRLAAKNVRFPSEVAKPLVLLSTWTTDLRYEAGPGNYGEAEAFLAAAKIVIEWAKGRM